MNLAPVHKIIPHSVVDGPGNRTAIFLQGCNLQCIYCHNPETQRICNHCGVCVEGCPTGALSKKQERVIWQEEKCILCGQCTEVCPSFSSPRIQWMVAKEVFQQIEKNIPFIRGITVSGGECTLYPNFLGELFCIAKKKKLSCLLDSNGTIDFSIYPALMELSDGIMLDVKAWDQKVFKKITGGNNELVKKNLGYLMSKGKLEEIRIVCLPGKVDAEEILKGIKDTIGKNIREVKLKLIQFRKHGVRGDLTHLDSPTEEYMNQLKQKAYEIGFRKIYIS